MDLRAFRYFIYVADNRSFSKAADALRISQPALSRSIKQLEQSFGVTLFRRSRRGIEMTQAGRLFRRRAKEILDRYHQIYDEVRAQADEITGNLTLGVPAAVGQLLIPALLNHLGKHYAGIRIRTIEGVSSENHDRLLNQSAQICVLYDPLPHRDLVLSPIAIEDMYLVARQELLDGIDAPCKLERLEGLPFILPSMPNSRRMLVENAFKANDLILNISAEVDSFIVTRSLLMEGKGYSLTTLSSIADLPRKAPLSYVELADSRITWVLSSAYNVVNSSNPAVQVVVAAIEQVARKLITMGIWEGARPPVGAIRRQRKADQGGLSPP